MKIPRHIKFENNCEGILRQSVLAVLPEEGCALLLGNHKSKRDNPEESFYEFLRIA